MTKATRRSRRREGGVGRPRGGGRSPDESQQHILDAAETVFARQGVPDATMTDIATEAGVSRAILYRHFGDRDSIVLGVLERAAGRLMESVFEITRYARDLNELLVDGLTTVLVAANDDPVLASAFGDQDRHDVLTLLADDANFGERARMMSEAVVSLVSFDFESQIRDGMPVSDAARQVFMFGLLLLGGPQSLLANRDELARHIRNFLLPAVSANPPPYT